MLLLLAVLELPFKFSDLILRLLFFERIGFGLFLLLKIPLLLLDREFLLGKNEALLGEVRLADILVGLVARLEERRGVAALGEHGLQLRVAVFERDRLQRLRVAHRPRRFQLLLLHTR